MQASALVALCKERGLLIEVLKKGGDRSQATRLGHELRKARDRFVGRFTIRQSRNQAMNSSCYALVDVNAAASSSPTTAASHVAVT